MFKRQVTAAPSTNVQFMERGGRGGIANPPIVRAAKGPKPAGLKPPATVVHVSDIGRVGQLSIHGFSLAGYRLRFAQLQSRGGNGKQGRAQPADE
jgi:hypothetical protein